jgi:hypothetical protein
VYWQFEAPLQSKPTWADFDPIATVYPTTDDLALGKWTPFTPTITNFTVGNGGLTGVYRRVGDSMEVKVQGRIGTTTVVGGAMALVIPFGLNTVLSGGNTNYMQAGVVSAYDDSTNANNTTGGMLFTGSTTNASFAYSIGKNIWTATSPFTWANNDAFLAEGSFQIAEWSDLGQVPPIGIQLATADSPGLVKAESGTYTPTVTNIANVIGSITVGVAKYTVIDGIVSVFGTIDTNAVTVNTFNELGISLPFPKTVSALNEISGTSSVRRASTYTNGGAIVGDVSPDNRAQLQIFNNSGNAASHTYYYSFSYELD